MPVRQLPPRSRVTRFVAVNVLVWLVMVVVLVVVPDWLEHWLGLELARVFGWAVAGGIWMLSVEPQWKMRMGPLMRFMLQTLLWVSAAFLAIWISEQARGGL